MRPLPSEQILIDSLPELMGDRFLVVSPGRAQLAINLVEKGHLNTAVWNYDLYPLKEAEAFGQSCGVSAEYLASADLPDREWDAVFMPILKRGEAELNRELMQQAHQRLREGGFLFVSVDNPTDKWLHEQMQVLFPKVTCQLHPLGRAYWGRKSGPLKRVRSFDCEVQFRDQENMLTIQTRPGVFSHRSLDGGARQLINCVDIGESDQVLDYGCGSGGVAIACAKRTSGQVFAVDSNARAIECTVHGARLNSVNNLHAIWNCDGNLNLPGKIDVALANPPYFADQKIGQHFVDACLANLRIGGALLVVTKQPRWFAEYLEPWLENLSIAPAGHYHIVHGWALEEAASIKPNN